MAVNLSDDYIELTLADGRRTATPLSFYPTLLAASSAQRSRYEYLGWATGLEWPEFDLQLSVDGIVAGRRGHVPPPGFRERTREAMLKAGLRLPK